MRRITLDEADAILTDLRPGLLASRRYVRLFDLAAALLAALAYARGRAARAAEGSDNA